MNSQLIKMEAIVNGYSEGIALDVNGYVSEGSGENLFVVRNGVLHTAPLGTPCFWITAIRCCRSHATSASRSWSSRFRASPCTLRMKFSLPAPPPRSRHSLGRQNRRGQGQNRPMTKSLQAEFYAIVRGEKADRYEWLTAVPVGRSSRSGLKSTEEARAGAI